VSDENPACKAGILEIWAWMRGTRIAAFQAADLLGCLPQALGLGYRIFPPLAHVEMAKLQFADISAFYGLANIGTKGASIHQPRPTA